MKTDLRPMKIYKRFMKLGTTIIVDHYYDTLLCLHRAAIKRKIPNLLTMKPILLYDNPLPPLKIKDNLAKDFVYILSHFVQNKNLLKNSKHY